MNPQPQPQVKAPHRELIEHNVLSIGESIKQMACTTPGLSSSKVWFEPQQEIYCFAAKLNQPATQQELLSSLVITNADPKRLIISVIRVLGTLQRGMTPSPGPMPVKLA
jgi:hypothetical protein